MYAVEVRDHIMIAHSLPDPVFGPAQNMHGATFIVDVAFLREEMTEHHFVVDIGRATEALSAVLRPLNYANLDDVPELKNVLTTTEFLCRYIFDQMAKSARAGDLGPGSETLSKIKVTLHESHTARAWFEGGLDLPPYLS